jgi:hypothetical protein
MLQSPFIPNQLYKRSLIHDEYGGFDTKGKIVLSDLIEFSAYQKLGITGQEQINGLSQYNLGYLIRHQELIK